MISVCIATYNGEKYIENQLRSILHQLSEEDEIIVSDDGSKDRTIDIVKDFNDSRIRIVNNEKHGVAFNFENAISNAKGDYIFLSDQDDEWLYNKVERCLTGLQTYHCIVTDCYICDGEGEIINKSFFSLNGTKKGKIYNLLVKSGYIGCCMAFRKEILAKVLPFPEDIPLHDLWIGNVAAFYYSLGWISDKLIKYRRHGNNASCAAEKSDASIIKKMGYRWHIIKHLI